uniref:Putative secreted protein n=1 Tax=Anopheles darlingi TaxID=43151 RepID=A0A2M4DQW7_ANODA
MEIGIVIVIVNGIVMAAETVAPVYRWMVEGVPPCHRWIEGEMSHGVVVVSSPVQQQHRPGTSDNPSPAAAPPPLPASSTVFRDGRKMSSFAHHKRT